MAKSATIFKLELQISDLDRSYYQSHDLTIACHPSETEQRMMVRVLAFALYANDRLAFTKGLCADDEPELWDKDYSDVIQLWIDLGQPDEKRIKKALGRSKQVVIFTYAGNKSRTWWGQNQANLEKYKNLQIIHIKPEEFDALSALVSRNMNLQCTIQEGEVWLSSSELNITLNPQYWLGSKPEPNF